MTLTLSACFNPWQGNEGMGGNGNMGSITISFGDEINRGASFLAPSIVSRSESINVPRDFINTLKINVTLKRGNEPSISPQVFQDSNGNFKVSVEPGIWQITVDMFLANGDRFAIGSREGITVEAGKNTNDVKISMQLSYYPINEENLKTIIGNEMFPMDGNYILTEPINLSGFDWVPIGFDDDDPFIGIFDGNGYTISNLKINSPDYSYIGLFGVIGENGIVRNVRLIDVEITGNTAVGSLAGVNGGTVENSYATMGNVTGNNYVGGLVGYNRDGDIDGYIGIVRNSYANVEVNGNIVGGLVGQNNGIVENSYAMNNVNGNFAGGLVGGNYGIVQNSYATGNVGSGSGSDYPSAGGLVGENLGTVQNCYATGNVEGSSNVGGLVGQNSATGTIQNSVALNSSIKTNVNTTGTLGRVVGNNQSDPPTAAIGILSNNYGRPDNMFTNNTPFNPSGTFGPDTKHGANVTDGTGADSTASWNNATFWSVTVRFDNNLWDLANGKLPTLKNMPPGTQNPQVRE